MCFCCWLWPCDELLELFGVSPNFHTVTAGKGSSRPQWLWAQPNEQMEGQLWRKVKIWWPFWTRVSGLALNCALQQQQKHWPCPTSSIYLFIYLCLYINRGTHTVGLTSFGLSVQWSLIKKTDCMKRLAAVGGSRLLCPVCEHHNLSLINSQVRVCERESVHVWVYTNLEKRGFTVNLIRHSVW